MRALRAQAPPMSWQQIERTLVGEAAAEAQAVIRTVQQEERRTAEAHAGTQPAGAGGMKETPILAA